MSLLDDARPQAIAVASELDDVRLLARAASCMTAGALWQSPAHGADHPVVIDALRRALEELPDDGAGAALPGDAGAGRRGLLHEPRRRSGRRWSRRRSRSPAGSGTTRCSLHACQIGFVATWRPRDGPAPAGAGARGGRAGAADRRRARPWSSPRPCARSPTASSARSTGCGRSGRAARAEALRLHLPYPQMVLDALFVPWLAEDGRFEEAEELMASVRGLSGQLRIVQAALAEVGALTSIQIWQRPARRGGRRAGASWTTTRCRWPPPS